MLKQKTFLIIIITVLCGFLAGAVAFYRQQQSGQTVSVDIISTIVPTEQEKSSAMTVTIDSLQYNQTLAAILNVRANGRSPLQENKFSSISWEADLNSAVLHAQTQINDREKADVIPIKLINIVQENADSLNAKHYANKISSKISLLSSSPSSSPNSPYYLYLITLLGLFVGYCLGVILVRKQF